MFKKNILRYIQFKLTLTETGADYGDGFRLSS